MNPSWHDWQILRLTRELLYQGITPHKLALTLALGVMLGVTPVLGSTTLLCAAAAVVFRINLPLIQVVNYLVYPLQLVLLIPFIDAGQWLFRAAPLPLSAREIAALVRTHPWHSFVLLWDYTLHGLAAWAILGGIAAAIIYLVMRPILARLLASRFAGVKRNPTES